MYTVSGYGTITSRIVASVQFARSEPYNMSYIARVGINWKQLNSDVTIQQLLCTSEFVYYGIYQHLRGLEDDNIHSPNATRAVVNAIIHS